MSAVQYYVNQGTPIKKKSPFLSEDSRVSVTQPSYKNWGKPTYEIEM